jgi:hypothetical protein
MIYQHMGCWLAKSPKAIKVVQLVDQIPLLAILKIWGKWFMNVIVGSYDLTMYPYQSNDHDFNGKYEKKKPHQL